ncbi:flagellar hook capping FlgD N-terminal domain-containing protein [Arcobacteraceae bacterium]|nr:flagellar hook capping FlgD N-terminal domain-containing protein [Arcobacteraceae bacterium]
MAIDNVLTSSSTGIDGNAYTTSVSNDTLTNEDFLTLMLEELKQQDPTDPQDSAALMDSQLQMSTIQANTDMTAAMTSLQSSYSSSALATASNLIGNVVEDGTLDSEGLLKSYAVQTVESIDGELFANTKQLVGIIDGLMNAETEELILYDANGNIYEDGEMTDYNVSLDEDGRFQYNEDGTLTILDDNNIVVTSTDITDKYVYAGSSISYSDEITVIAFSNINEVR